jgi:hypothetical protein
MGDSHDNLPLMRRAVSLFNQRGVGLVLHTGDIISPFAARELAKLTSPFAVTFGNNDGEKLLLKETIASSGGELIWPKAVISREGHKIALLHGEDRELVAALAKSGEFSMVAYGHWHEPSIEKSGGSTLVINPGETCGYLTGRATVAIADLEAMEAELLDL